jgi:hypothetical protein
MGSGSVSVGIGIRELLHKQVVMQRQLLRSLHLGAPTNPGNALFAAVPSAFLIAPAGVVRRNLTRFPEKWAHPFIFHS